MPDSVQRNGRDTFVNSAAPNGERNKNEKLKLISGQAHIYVYLPLPGVRKRTIEQATLSGLAAVAMPAQTLTVTPVGGDWSPRTTTWNEQPALRTAQAVNVAIPATAAGQRFEVDVTAHVQKVADGTKHYGWRIATNSGSTTQRVAAFDAPGPGWVLEVDFVEAPEPPTDLSPNGNVVGTEPTLTFDFTDLGGASTELAAVRVQVSTSASESGAWTSPETATTTPEFNLATSAWPTTPVSGTTYYWRVQVKDGAGYWSDYSDWASFVYAPKPSVIVDNPATGIAWDVTPTIAAHISTGTIKAWRIRIARGDDKSKVIYDSGKRPGNGTNALAHTIPLKTMSHVANPTDGRPVTRRPYLRDDRDYWLNIRVWDRNDREATPGDPTWTQVWTQFHLDDDLTPPPPTNLQATQVGDTPRVRLAWVRDTGAPEGWIIRRDGEVIARLEPDEVEVDLDADVYSWVDNSAPPFIQHVWTVRVIDGGKKTAPSNEVHLTPEASGVWLLAGDDAEAVLAGIDVDGFSATDKRARYALVNEPYDLDIVHSLGGVAGAYVGSISSFDDWESSKAALMAMRSRTTEAVRLVYGTVNIPVLLANVTVLPAPEMLPNNMLHVVRFDAMQVGEFEDDD